jgi:hypothetical protein
MKSSSYIKLMRKVMILLVAPIFVSTHTMEPLEICYEETIIQLEPKSIQMALSERDLVSALILVESRGNDSAIGDRHIVGGEAVGALQIRPIMVREVNRILKIQKSDKRFTLKDRFDREKTIEMFYVWKNFHHKDSDFETIARNWNGGPKGYKNSRTLKYWSKVQKELDDTTIR